MSSPSSIKILQCSKLPAFAAFTNPNGNDLNAILANHVIAGVSAFSSGLSTTYIKTAATKPMSDENLDMYIDVSNGVKINGSSNVVLADVVASNGVIHAVDQVIDLPTVVTMALANPAFETLVAALTREDLTTDLVSILNGSGELYPFTVFAPTNDAFANLLAFLEISGLGDIDEPTLSATLMNHVVSGANVKSTDLVDQMSVSTLSGTQTIDLTDGAKIIDGNNRAANIILVDVQTANGIIHVIDEVILPQLN